MVLTTLSTGLVVQAPKWLEPRLVWVRMVLNAILIWVTSPYWKRKHSLTGNSNISIVTASTEVSVAPIEQEHLRRTKELSYNTAVGKLMTLGILLTEYLRDDPHWLMPYRNEFETLTVESNDLWLLALLKTKIDNTSYWSLYPVSVSDKQAENVRYIYS